MSNILDLLKLVPSAQSNDYVDNKKQFHLFNLLTEQRHAKTWNLSFVSQSDTEAGLRMLLSVDEDIAKKIVELMQNPAPLEQAARAVKRAILEGYRIYVYGCGATGRLAKQMESTFWRPFWKHAMRQAFGEKLRRHLGDRIEDALVGEMTGADRALVSSLEGFEDLQLIGRLQLQDHGIMRGDIVFCVTEGGETSSVIGTILGALDQYGVVEGHLRDEARNHLYFICNNPEDVLLPFSRSASVLGNPAITHINLTTGPQAITGSTRMQATTIETFVLAVILEQALDAILRDCLNEEEMLMLGFGPDRELAARLSDFDAVKVAVDRGVEAIARFTDIETSVYLGKRFTTYLADKALITVFIDSTERSPTFRLYPLDKIEDVERRCWVQVWTEAEDSKSAWKSFLGRPFRGLEPSLYQPAFEHQVLDPYLREAALRSLKNAGHEQEVSYDFSFSPSNVARREPSAGDLGILVLMDEEMPLLETPESGFRSFLDLFRAHDAETALLVVGIKKKGIVNNMPAPATSLADVSIPILLDCDHDPLSLRRQIALKMLLNAHSTAIMAKLGRVIGNTMTSVSPSNLKLIGRATYLILSHVNDILAQPGWISRHGIADTVTFAEANAVLLDAMDYVRAHEMGQTAEVALSIIRIIETFDRAEGIDWPRAQNILENEGLAPYLVRHNPALAQPPAAK